MSVYCNMLGHNSNYHCFYPPRDKRYGNIPVEKQNKPIVKTLLIAVSSYGSHAASCSGSPCASYGGSYMNNPNKPLG